MKGIKEIFKIIRCNFASWIVNYKIYLVVFLLIVFVGDNFTGVFEFAKQMRYRVSPYLFPFCFTHPFMKMIIFSCVFFLFSNAPFVSEFHLLLLSRTGKKKWYIAQIIYLAICSVLLTGFITILPILKNITMIAFINDWGKILQTLARQYDVVHPISYATVNWYSAHETMLYTCCISVLLMMFLGMVLFLCNILFKNQSVGVMVASAFVLFDWFVYLMDNKTLLWISPISWIQISNMAYAREQGIPSQTFSIVCLIILNSLLMVFAYNVSKRKDVINM